MGMFMRYPGGLARCVTLSYDDGVQTDIRLGEIMKKNGLKGTFNINGGGFAKEGTVYAPGTVHRRMSESECLSLYNDPSFEVALHGYTHPSFGELPIGMTAYEVIRDREKLENMFGTPIRGLAYPNGSYSDEVVTTLRMCGVVYARTTHGTRNFNLPEDWLKLHPTCHHNDGELMKLAERFLTQKTVKNPLMFYLWGHSYEFDGADNWHVIEEFASYIGGKEDVWYATNIEIYDYCTAFRRLETSADGRYVKNPSAISVWFSAFGKTWEVRPGETLCLK